MGDRTQLFGRQMPAVIERGRILAGRGRQPAPPGAGVKRAMQSWRRVIRVSEVADAY
jgi:hypothetical protein